MSDIDIHPSDLLSSGRTLGAFGQQLASGGEKLETAGQNLISSASGDESGFGAVITKAFGEGVKVTGGVFKEGGGWLSRAGGTMTENGQSHTANEEEQTNRFRGIRPGEEDDAPSGGSGGGSDDGSGGSGGGSGSSGGSGGSGTGGGGSGGSGGGGSSGPVDVVIPPTATPAQVKQFENYAAGANRAVAANALSQTGRVASTKNGVRKAATKAAKAERTRATAAGTPYTGVAGHVPDAAWMGQGEPHSWQDMDKSVNSSLAGQINRYPVGYRPTRFRVVYPKKP